MSLNCKTPEDVAKAIAENDVRHVDLRFTDPRGKWQHLTQVPETIDDDAYTDGIFFDGSSIAGWRAINESDMTMIPDPVTAVMDPFTQQPTLILICDVHDPVTGEQYSRDPRSTAKRAEAHLKGTGIGDTAFFGPEPEFFVFDDVRYDVSMSNTFYSIDEEEGPYNTGRNYEGGNIGHRPPAKGGYFPVPPVDSHADLRAEMITVMAEMGVSTEKHHHAVAPSQNELGMEFSTLLKTADAVQIYKYVVHNVAHSYGKTATFMP
ncbi:MAG: glutamine synthetase beta-grasp domain-containing protein, partial [Rhodospirillales bacterium]